MNKRTEAAIEYKHNGYNCAQSVVLAFSDLIETDRELLANLSSGFGAGMGGMEGNCGALCGAVLVAGLLKKAPRISSTSKQIFNNFKELCGAVTCKDLKGIETGEMLCSCDDCVKNAVLSLSETLELENINLTSTVE